MTQGTSERYVALLRGINVGGARKISMRDLASLATDLGFSDVRTVLNSGNVVFTASRPRAGDAASRIEGAVYGSLGVPTRVVVLPAARFGDVLRENPLVTIADNLSRLLVAFVSDPRQLVRLAPLSGRDWSPEALTVGRHSAYLWCPAGTVASPLARAIGRELGDLVTTRSWATVLKIGAVLG